MPFSQRLREVILGFLHLTPAPRQSVQLLESVDFGANVARNRVWYRGDPSELSQLAKQLSASGADDTAATRFWAQAPAFGQIRKAHTGLPAVMADTLGALVKADCGPFAFGDAALDARFAALAQSAGLYALIGHAVTETLVTGDGAFKISVDPAASPHPMVEFRAADRVRYRRRRGRVEAVEFLTPLESPTGQEYMLSEVYAEGCVDYRLLDSAGNPCALPLAESPKEGRAKEATGEAIYTKYSDKTSNSVCGEAPDTAVSADCTAADDAAADATAGGWQALAGLRPARFAGGFTLAVPLQFFASSRFPGRGRSIYDSKTDAFDALDEVFSQWIDAVRAGRVLRYIPDDLVPRSPETGALQNPGYFASNFVITGHSSREDARDRIEMQQADIRYQAFSSSYAAMLDLCLQGILSPATLGINVGRMASAENQRERKDATGFTRGAIVDALEQALPRLAVSLLRADDLMQGRAAGSYPFPSVRFGEYAAPDFETRVNTLAVARKAGLISRKAAVAELWGAGKTPAQQAGELAALEQEDALQAVRTHA